MHFAPRLLVPALLAATACGDGGGPLTSDTLASTPVSLSDPQTSEPISDSVTPTSEGPVTTGSVGPTSGADSTGGTATGSTSDTPATATETTTGPVTATTTDPGTTTAPDTTSDPGTTTVAPGSSSGETSDGTTVGCACEPGDTDGCQGAKVLVCGADCQGFEAKSCPMGQSCADGACAALQCQPGAKQCDGEGAYKQCNANGTGFDPSVPCDADEVCQGGACLSACDLAEASPSSIGCSFVANRLDNFDNSGADTVLVVNPSKTRTASVQLYLTPNNFDVEQAQGPAVAVAPGMMTELKLINPAIGKISLLRKGGSYRVVSDIPVAAFQHSTLANKASADASLLLPQSTLRLAHVVASYTHDVGDYPSYFQVVATANNTVVKWTPQATTTAGNGVAAVAPGATGQVVLNRADTLQVRVSSLNDISGTVITGDKPIWVAGAANCVNVPAAITFCDHIQEQMLPLDYWGKKYVGAHSPTRSLEKHYWRIYGGQDGTTVTAEPALPGTPVVVDKGEWADIVAANNTSTVFTSTKAFMAVQYLEGNTAGAQTGDPSMYQMVPVEQYLSSYAFATGTGYTTNYAQIIRLKGNPNVLVDGVTVTGFVTVGAYEVADYKVTQGAHFAESAAPFGLIVLGYTAQSSYAAPGGLKLAVINPQ